MIEKKNSIFWVIIGIVLISGISIPVIFWIINSQQPNASQYTNISVEVAHDMINDNATYPNLIVLDVRSQSEFDEGHIKDALLIPLNELESRIGELTAYKEIEIIVYCRTGSRSSQASQILVNHGFSKIYNMLGGYLAWVACEECITT